MLSPPSISASDEETVKKNTNKSKNKKKIKNKSKKEKKSKKNTNKSDNELKKDISSDPSYKTTSEDEPDNKNENKKSEFNKSENKEDRSEQDSIQEDFDLDEYDKKLIISNLEKLTKIEDIFNKLEKTKKIKAEEYIREKTIGYELEAATKLQKKLKKLKNFNKWVEEKLSDLMKKKNDNKTDTETSSSEEEERKPSKSQIQKDKDSESPEKRNTTNLKKLLMMKLSKLKKIDLAQQLSKKEPKQMPKLRKYLYQIFKNKCEYQELLYNKLEYQIIKFNEMENKKDKKESMKIINKMFEKQIKKDIHHCIDLLKKYELTKNKRFKMPEKYEHLMKFEENLWDKILQPEINSFYNDLLENIKEHELKDSILKLFDSCIKKSFFSSEFIKFIENMIKDFEVEEIYKFLLIFSKNKTNKIRTKLSETFYWNKKIDLEFFNKVNLSQSKEEGKKIFKELSQPEKPSFDQQDIIYQNTTTNVNNNKNKYKNPFMENVLDQLIGNIKRSERCENLMIFLGKVEWLKKDLSFVNPRLILTYFLSLADSPVCLRTQTNISKTFAVPLTFYDPRFFLKPKTKFLKINYQMKFAVLPSFSLLNLNVGLMSRVRGDYENLLNKLFYTKFEVSRSLLFRTGCVDVNFDRNSDNPRPMSFLTMYGEMENTFILEKLEPLVNMVMVQVSYFDLTKQENNKEIDLINQIIDFSKIKNMPVFLVVRGFKGNFKSTQKEKKKLLKILKNKNKDLKILFMSRLNFKKPNGSKFGKEIMREVNEEFRNLGGESQKMNQDNFFNYVVQDEDFLRNEKNHKLGELKDISPIDKKLGELVTQNKKELKNLKQSITQVDTFSRDLQNSIDQDNFREDFFFNNLFLQKRKNITEIRQKQHKKKELEVVTKLENKIEAINDEIRTKKPSRLMEEFYRLVMSEHFATILILLVKRLREMNESVQKPMKKELDELKNKLNGTINKDEKQRLKGRIQELFIISLGSAISVEVLFRNLFPYLERNSSWLKDNQREQFKDRIIDMLLCGFSLELVDGENLEFKPNFFIDYQSKIGTSKVCTIGCMGPQSSGKSTLLNYMFGTLFHTSQGRCTSGLYLSIQRVRDPKSSIKYLVIVDSEGLHSSERNDPEYDRKICSFLMNNIDLLMVNVNGEMTNTMTKDLEITLFTANKLKSFKKVPEIYFVFNQSSVNNKETNQKLHKQILGMNQKIINGMKRSTNNMDSKEIQKFNLEKKYINVLGNAFVPEFVEADKEFGQFVNYSFKQSSKQFGQETSVLSKIVLEYVMNISLDLAMKNFGRFFKKSSEGWKMIEKYTDLTSIADIETMNKRFEIDEATKQFFIIFKPKFSNDIDDKLLQLDEFIQNTEDTEDLKKKLDAEVVKQKNALKSSLEKWKSDTNKELEGGGFNLDMRDEYVGKYAKKLELYLIGYNLEVSSKTKVQIVGFYNKTGRNMIMSKAKNLRSKKYFMELSDWDKQKDVDKVFKEVYEGFLQGFNKDTEIEELEEYQYDMIFGMARSLNSLLPVKRHFLSTTDVSVESCAQKLKREVIKDPNMIIISEDKIRNMDPDFDIRVGVSTPVYLDVRGCVEPTILVECFENVQIAFDKDEYLKNLYEVLYSIDPSDHFKVENAYNYKNKLMRYGISFDFPNLETFKKKIKDKYQLSFYVQNLIKYPKFSKYKLSKIEPDDRKFFKIQKKSLKKEEVISESRRYDYFQELHKNAVPSSSISDFEKRKNWELFVNPLDCENQSRVVRAMKFVVIEKFDFEKLVKEIRKDCYEIIFNTKDEDDNEKVDLNKVSEVSSEMLTRIVSQCLPKVIFKVDNELDICCAEMSDPMIGFLVYIAIMFVWKFIVQAMTQKHKRKYGVLTNQEQEYRQLFINTAMDNKEEQPLDVIKSKIHDMVLNVCKREHIKVEKKAQDLVKKDSVRNLYKSQEIHKLLTQRYFYDTTPEDFEDTYMFMKDPERKWKEYIANEIDQKHFHETVERLDKERSSSINAAFERLLLVLELLQKKFLKDIKDDKYAITNFFELYKDSEKTEKIEKDIYVQDVKDDLAEIGFNILRSVVRGQDPECHNEVGENDVYTQFIISKDRVKKWSSKIMKNKDLVKLCSDEEEQGVLCPMLDKILENSESKNQNKIYNFKVFFEVMISRVNEVIQREIANRPVNRENLNIDKVYQEYQKNALGCVAKCRFCHKKCDHPEPATPTNPHQHHANITGHQPRIFANAYVNKFDKKIASKICCDLVQKDREIKVGEKIMTWEQMLQVEEMKDWEVVAGKSVEEFKEMLDAYEKMWKIHGKSICQRIGKGIQDDGKTIREFIKEYNENKKEVSIHYIIAVDESGSMTSHNRFGIAMEGVQDFIKYLRKHINDTMCYVTLILFDHRSRVINSGVLLREFPGINVTQRNGGTNFSKVLGECINSINTHKDKVELNRILFYTDGFAGYPSNQINMLNEMITQKGFNLRLHYFTVDAFDRSNPNNVFDKSQSVLGKNCTIDMEVESENLTKKFIEIFELD